MYVLLNKLCPKNNFSLHQRVPDSNNTFRTNAKGFQQLTPGLTRTNCPQDRSDLQFRGYIPEVYAKYKQVYTRD